MRGSIAFIALCLVGAAVSATKQGTSAAALNNAICSHKHKPPWLDRTTPHRISNCETSDFHASQAVGMHNGRPNSVYPMHFHSNRPVFALVLIHSSQQRFAWLQLLRVCEGHDCWFRQPCRSYVFELLPISETLCSLVLLYSSRQRFAWLQLLRVCEGHDCWLRQPCQYQHS